MRVIAGGGRGCMLGKLVMEQQAHLKFLFVCFVYGSRCKDGGNVCCLEGFSHLNWKVIGTWHVCDGQGDHWGVSDDRSELKKAAAFMRLRC